jgi:hypothetical protein
MGFQMYSRTSISGKPEAIKEISELLHNAKELEERFPIVEVFALPKVTYNEGEGHIEVMLSTRKRVPEDFFAYCESLGCSLWAFSDHEDADECYDTETERECGAEARAYELEQLELKLMEEEDRLEEIEYSEPERVMGQVSMKMVVKATISVLKQDIETLKEKISGDVWNQALEGEGASS